MDAKPMSFEEACETNAVNYKTYVYKFIDGGLERSIVGVEKAKELLKKGWHLHSVDAYDAENPNILKSHAESKSQELEQLERQACDEMGIDADEHIENIKDAISPKTIEAAVKECSIDADVLEVRLLNIDKIDTIEGLQNIAEYYQDDNGQPLISSINWKIKGRRTLEKVRSDLKAELDRIGVPYGDSEKVH